MPTFRVGPSFSNGQNVVWNTGRHELAEVIAGFQQKFGHGPFVVVKTESHPHLSVSREMRPKTRHSQSVMLMFAETNELVMETDKQPAWIASALLREF